MMAPALLPAPTGLPHLISALRARRLDKTLTTALPVAHVHDDLTVGPTGVPDLDDRLSGGLPRGQLSEIAGPRSSGRTSLMLQTIAAATGRGELVALVDTLDMLDLASALAAGVECSRLLWIRGHGVMHPGPCRDLNTRALEQAVKALSLVLQAGNFGLVILDLGEAPADEIRRLPFTTWLRIQRMVEGSQTVALIVSPAPLARSAAGLTIKLQPAGGGPGARVAARGAGRFGARSFAGLDIEVQVARARVQRHDSLGLPIATRAACHV
ncbi:MAG: hypothetical protein AB7Q29_16475 [Vicinamibacterales bacterium]